MIIDYYSRTARFNISSSIYQQLPITQHHSTLPQFSTKQYPPATTHHHHLPSGKHHHLPPPPTTSQPPLLTHQLPPPPTTPTHHPRFMYQPFIQNEFDVSNYFSCLWICSRSCNECTVSKTWCNNALCLQCNIRQISRCYIHSTRCRHRLRAKAWLLEQGNHEQDPTEAGFLKNSS